MPQVAFAPKDKPAGNLPYPTPTLLAAAWSTLDRGDMPSITGRNRIVDDGGHVWECELRDTDRSGYTNSCRNEVYWDKDKLGGIRVGETAASAFGLWLDPAFPTPPAWMLAWQIHTPSDYPPGYASPMTALVLDDGKFRIRNNAQGTVLGEFPYDRGRWHYLVIEAPMKREPVTVKVWHSLDVLPDVTKPPAIQGLNQTVPPSGDKPSYVKAGLYRSNGSAGQVHVVRYDGLVVDTSAAAALHRLRGVCRAAAIPNTTPPPPPPPSPSAHDLIRASIDHHQLNAWYYRKFQDHNPVLAPLVVGYLAGTGRRPTDQELGDNHYARGLVYAEDARRLLT